MDVDDLVTLNGERSGYLAAFPVLKRYFVSVLTSLAA